MAPRCISMPGLPSASAHCRGGRTPELDDLEVLEWIGRFLARIHTVGAAQPFAHRPALDLQTFAIEPRDWLLAHEMIPLDVQSAWRGACEKAIDLIAAWRATHNALEANLELKAGRIIRLHGDCHPGNILWTPARPTRRRPALCGPGRRPHGPRRARPVDAAVATAPSAPVSWAHCWMGTSSSDL
jgi:hypothetical protein